MKWTLAFLAIWPCLLFAQGYPGANDSKPIGSGEPPNDPPVWASTPTPVFSLGISASYCFITEGDLSDPEVDTLTLTNEGVSEPTSITTNDTTDCLDYAGGGSVGDTSGMITGADDGTNPRQDSASYTVSINAIAGAGTIYERDMFGVPRTGTSGATEAEASHVGNPVAELDYVVDIAIADYPCDVTILQADPNWNDLNGSGANVCIEKGDHSAKGKAILTEDGSPGATKAISAITLNNPVRVDFSVVHGFTTGDLVWFDIAAGETWQVRERFFKVTVIDTDTVDLDGQDGTGAGVYPLWATYTSGGTAVEITPKVIRHADDLVVHPVLLASSDRAKIRQMDVGSVTNPANYVLLIGLTFDHKGLASSIGGETVRHLGGDFVIYDQIDWYNEDALSDIEADGVQDFIRGSPGGGVKIDYTQVQRSTLHDCGVGFSGDQCQAMTWTPSASLAIRIIKNEIYDVTPGQALNAGNWSGFTYAENSNYITTKYLSDCDGNLVGGSTYGADDNSPCSALEGGMAFKGGWSTTRLAAVTNANRHELIVADANIICCMRSEDPNLGFTGDGTSGGQPLQFSDVSDKHSVLFRNNIGLSNQIGIYAGLQRCNDVTEINNISTVGNLMMDPANVLGTAWPWFQCSLDSHDFNEAQFNTIQGSGEWGDFGGNDDTTIECNLALDAGSKGTSGTVTLKNNYFYNTTGFDGAGDTDGGNSSNANMGNITIKPKLYSDAAFTYVITGSLSSSSSPHEGDCPSIGTAGQGVTDSTVTY